MNHSILFNTTQRQVAGLVKTLKYHFEPAPLPIAITERFHFHRHVQAPNETVTKYVAQLRGLTTHCRYTVDF